MCKRSLLVLDGLLAFFGSVANVTFFILFELQTFSSTEANDFGDLVSTALRC